MKSIAARYNGRRPSASGSRAPDTDCSSSSSASDGLRKLQDFALTQLVDLLMQALYLDLRLHIDPIVVLRGLAIDALLPVLAYHGVSGRKLLGVAYHTQKL